MGALNIADRQYGIGRGLCAVRANWNLDQRFLWWLLHAQVPRLHSLATGSTYDAITSEGIGSLQVSVPDVATQRLIGDYLDAETARIDTLIEKKRRMVELLERRRLSVIADAVGVKMGRSRVAGRHRMKYACRIERGRFTRRPRNDPVLYGGEAPFVQTGDIRAASKFIRSFSQTLNELGQNTSRSFPSGTTLMAIAANVGDVAITTFETWCPDSVVGFIPVRTSTWSISIMSCSAFEIGSTRHQQRTPKRTRTLRSWESCGYCRQQSRSRGQLQRNSPATMTMLPR